MASPRRRPARAGHCRGGGAEDPQARVLPEVVAATSSCRARRRRPRAPAAAAAFLQCRARGRRHRMGGTARDARIRRRSAGAAEPVAEVDMQRFIHARRRLGEECMETFTGFALDARRSVSRFVLFDVAERARAAPLALKQGRHYFEFYAKASNARQPKLEASFAHVRGEAPRRLSRRSRRLPHRLPDHAAWSAPALAESEWPRPGRRKALRKESGLTPIGQVASRRRQRLGPLASFSSASR